MTSRFFPVLNALVSEHLTIKNQERDAIIIRNQKNGKRLHFDHPSNHLEIKPILWENRFYICEHCKKPLDQRHLPYFDGKRYIPARQFFENSELGILLFFHSECKKLWLKAQMKPRWEDQENETN